MGLIKMNGVNYWGSAYGQGIIAPMIYSEEEIEVGVWRDGKPLYQKSYQLTTPSTTGSAIVIQNIADLNLDTPVNIYGNVLNVPINFVFDYLQNNYVACFVNTAKTGIAMKIGANIYANQSCNVTLQYTKTTDVAGSGTWTPSGVPSVHYSTNEQVIGTWVDGKPVYEISLDLNGMNIDRNMFFNTGVLLSSHNIKSFVSDGTLIDNQTIRQAFPCCMVSMAGNTTIGVGVNWFGSADTRTFDYLIFRFTKTTD